MEIMELINVKKYFEQMSSYENIILFGCGAKGQQAVKILKEHGVEITDACDNNVELQGKEFIDNIFIQSFDEAIKGKKDFCVIITCAINSALEIYNAIKCRDNTIPIYHLSNPFKVENNLLKLDKTELYKEVNYNFELLEDEESKQVYCDTINWKLCGDMLPMQKYNTGKEILAFFDKDIISVNEETTYVDVGAYTGDSIESFLIFSGGDFKKIIGFEADKNNFEALEYFIKYSRVKNIEIYNMALWDTEEEKVFYTNSVNKDIHYDSPNLFQSIDQIADNKTLSEIQRRGHLEQLTLQTSTLDKVLSNEVPTIIKINALAADYNILLGGEKLISQHKPSLILEFGVKEDDIFHMMKTIKEKNSAYRFYMRRKKIYGDIKTILYAV